jgi:hypothetical protein
MSTKLEQVQIEEHDQRLSALEKTVAELETKLSLLVLKTEMIPAETAVSLDDSIAEKELGLALLRAKGLISEPTEREREIAAEWRALSEEEKREHREFMDSLRLDPPLSQIILDNRR